MSADDRRIVGEDIKDVEFAWPIGMPLCRPLSRGLWEVRSTLTQGRIARVLFCEHEGKMILLHAFIKKTQELRRAIWISPLSARERSHEKDRQEKEDRSNRIIL